MNLNFRYVKNSHWLWESQSTGIGYGLLVSVEKGVEKIFDKSLCYEYNKPCLKEINRS